MRGKRSKQYRKLMHAYALTFHFRAPYQVLLSSTIIRDAARFKMQLGSMLSNTLHGEIKPMITQCCIRHLYNAVPEPGHEADKERWIEVAKSAERRRCGHHELETPLSEEECIRSVVDAKGSGTNKHRYVVATQEREVRAAMREVAGVPLIYINRSVMVLEPMAERSAEVREAEEKGKVRAGLKARRGAEAGAVKRKAEEEDGEESEGGGAQEEAAAPKKKKARGPKGPNPLSVKKPKKENQEKSAGKKVEEERSVLRKAAKQDPQAAKKAVKAEVAVGEGGASADGASGKRKRRRKPKESGDAASALKAEVGDEE